MATIGTHIPTRGAVPMVPYMTFGDKFLETQDFFGRLPDDVIRYLARQGINTPAPAVMGAMTSLHIFDYLKFPVKEAFVNILLSKTPEPEKTKLKEKLSKHEWEFPADKPKYQMPGFG